MLLPIMLLPSGVKTPEFRGLFGTAEAVPSRIPFVRWLLVSALLVFGDFANIRRAAPHEIA